MNKIIITSILLFFGGIYVLEQSINREEIPYTEDCFYNPDPDSYAPNRTKEECEQLKADFRAEQKEKQEKGKPIGCHDGSYCESNFKHYNWKQNWTKVMKPSLYTSTVTVSGNEMLKKFGTTSTSVLFEYDWIETEDSKFCSPYAQKKVSDLPVKCLDYFEIKK